MARPSPSSLLAPLLLGATLILLPAATRAQDADGDGMPDSYEETFADCLQILVDDASVDYDADGLSSLDEYLLSDQLDPCSPDTDHDALGDGLETNSGVFLGPADPGTDPTNSDTDGDGAPDGWEANLGANPLDPRVDPGELGLIGPRIEVTEDDDLDSEWPSVVWTGSEYGMIWLDRRSGTSEVYFSRISAAGLPFGPQLNVSGPKSYDSLDPSLAWTGSQFGVVWWYTGTNEAYFARISAAGAKLGTEVMVSTSDSFHSISPSLAWTGSQFGIAFTDNRTGVDRVYFRRVSATGSKLGSEQQISDQEVIFPDPTTIVWTGSEFGLAWIGGQVGYDHPVCFARVSATGSPIGGTHEVFDYNTSSLPIPLTWTGSEFGLSLTEPLEDWEIYFFRISSGGDLIGSEINASDSEKDSWSPAMTWTGSEYALAWAESQVESEIYFSLLSSSGAKIGQNLAVTGVGDWSVMPSLTWTGSEFGLTWAQYQYGVEVYFARIGYLDQDGDGLLPAEEGQTGTNPQDWDTDDDLMPDGFEVHRGWICGLDPFSDDAGGDNDSDGLTNIDEYNEGTDPCAPDSDEDGLDDLEETTAGTDGYLTNPNDPDSDDDGLYDGEEVYAYGTSPLGWDTDGDCLPDGFEATNSSGHDPGQDLSPTNPADATLDFDGDLNPNLHEFYNQTDPWAADPVPDPFASPACYYWADGDGDGVIGPGDLAISRQMVADGAPTYASVLPGGVFDTQDVDKDGVPGPGDISFVQDMIVGVDRPSGYPSSPVALGVTSAPGGTLNVGDTCHVTVEVANQSLEVTRSGAFAVVFSLDPASTGSAMLLGGEGEDLGQGFTNRYDISGLSTAGGKANIVLKATGAGTVIVRAKVPACGIGTAGRWCGEVNLAPAVVVTVQ